MILLLAVLRTIEVWLQNSWCIKHLHDPTQFRIHGDDVSWRQHSGKHDVINDVNYSVWRNVIRSRNQHGCCSPNLEINKKGLQSNVNCPLADRHVGWILTRLGVGAGQMGVTMGVGSRGPRWISVNRPYHMWRPLQTDRMTDRHDWKHFNTQGKEMNIRSWIQWTNFWSFVPFWSLFQVGWHCICWPWDRVRVGLCIGSHCRSLSKIAGSSIGCG